MHKNIYLLQFNIIKQPVFKTKSEHEFNNTIKSNKFENSF